MIWGSEGQPHPKRNPCYCRESRCRRWVLTVAIGADYAKHPQARALFDREVKRWVGTVLTGRTADAESMIEVER